MSDVNGQIEINIDGETITCQPGETIIQAADRHGIYIPRFCYHEKLSVVANCRMCLVEVAKAAKALPACATQVMPDMTVFTKSKVALDAQRAVMSFLLINHPLDCPICDQGGECDLQDIAMGFGEGISKYTDKKRAVKDEDLGEFIATDMTRCIHCTRCIRFGDEIAGIPELVLTQRGGSSVVSTYLLQGIKSELSGNMIDICPVGALTSKPFRFHGRSWGYQQHAMIAPHDCVGSNLFAHVNNTDADGVAKIMRVLPKSNMEVNDQWISDTDRFSYLAAQSQHRLTTPKIKIKDRWQEVTWSEALKFAADGIRGVIDQKSLNAVAALMSPSAYLEEAYMFQKVMRSQGIIHLDHRMRCLDASYQEYEGLHPGLGMTLAQFQHQEHFWIIGGDVRRQQPMLNHRIRQAVQGGAEVSLLHAFDPQYNFEISQYDCHSPEAWPAFLLEVLKACLGRKKTPDSLLTLLRNIEPSEQATILAKRMKDKNSGVIVLGLEAYHHPQAGLLRDLAEHLAIVTDYQVACLTDGSNAAGMWLAGVLPHRGPFSEAIAKSGDHQVNVFEVPKSAYWLHQFSPQYDSVNPGKAMAALQAADFVVSCQSFEEPHVHEVADVILPIAMPWECSGTVINAEGRWQFSRAVTEPLADARPAWKVYRVLGNFWHMEDMAMNVLEDVQAEIEALQQQALIPEAKSSTHYQQPLAKPGTSDWSIVTHWPSGAQDSMVRHVDILQNQAGQADSVRMHPDDLAALQLNGEQIYIMKDKKKFAIEVVADPTVSPKTVIAMVGGDMMTALDTVFGTVDIVGDQS